ncbi:peroxiredoxin prx5 [Exophiala xenobiotica]
MAAFALSELLPNKWRHIGVVITNSTTLLAVILAPVTARYGYETGGWKWNFWAAAIAQFVAFLGLLFLYYPPAHPHGIPIKQMVMEVDYIGRTPLSSTCARLWYI